jgi:hypothetical protein
VKKLVEERTRIAELELKQERIKQRTAEETAMFERLSRETALARTSYALARILPRFRSVSQHRATPHLPSRCALPS